MGIITRTSWSCWEIIYGSQIILVLLPPTLPCRRVTLKAHRNQFQNVLKSSVGGLFKDDKQGYQWQYTND